MVKVIIVGPAVPAPAVMPVARVGPVAEREVRRIAVPTIVLVEEEALRKALAAAAVLLQGRKRRPAQAGVSVKVVLVAMLIMMEAVAVEEALDIMAVEEARVMAITRVVIWAAEVEVDRHI